MIHRDPEARRQKWYATLGGVLLFVALGVAGTMDAEDAERDYRHCREMVEIGAWPEGGVDCAPDDTNSNR